MVRIAERKLLELQQRKSPDADVQVDYLYRRPGNLLTSDELEQLYDMTGCLNATPPRDCSKEVNVNNYRTFDGVCNNLKNPTYGATTTPFRRILPAAYEDGVSVPRGYSQAIVNCTSSGTEYCTSEDGCDPTTSFHSTAVAESSTCINFQPPLPSSRYTSWQIILDKEPSEYPYTHILMQFAQFVDHDINMGPDTSDSAAPPCNHCDFTDVCDPIRVSGNDTYFGLGTLQNADCLPLRRTASECVYDPPGQMPPRQQLNDVTSYLDASTVYASTRNNANRLRTFQNGLLKSSPPLFPGTKEILPYDTDCEGDSCDYVQCMFNQTCFLCGDVRCNDQTTLTILHIIWLRQHNRIAPLLQNLNPDWDDETIFQETRKIVGSMIQKIAYKDYLPKIFTQTYFDLLIGNYESYDESLDAQITSNFDAAAYRYGHSLIRPTFDRLGPDYTPVMPTLNLVDMFFNPPQLNESGGTDPLLRGMITSDSLKIDEYLNYVITTELFKPPTGDQSGMDLASLNLQRAREHGILPYNNWKNYCKQRFPFLPEAQFSNPSTVDNIMRIYGSVDSLDLFIGGLAEVRLPDGLIGPTFACLFALTFKNLRDGDRFYYENPNTFTTDQRNQIEATTLSRVICDNGDDITTIQPDSFLSNQTRVPCSQIPAFDPTPWKVYTSYIKVSAPKSILKPGKIVSVAVRRDGESPSRVYTNTRSESCLPVPSATDSARVAAYVFPNLRDLNSCKFTSTISHEKVQDESASFFSSKVTKDDLYDSLDKCKAAKTASIIWTCSEGAKLKDRVTIEDKGDAQPSETLNSPDSMTTAPPSLFIRMNKFFN